MDRGAWRPTVHGVTRVRHNLVTKPHHPIHSAYSMPGTALGLLEGEKNR